MSKEVATKSNQLVEFTNDQVQLIKNTLLDTAETKFSNDELTLFIQQCKRTGLDPFTRQIYATKNKKTSKLTIQATIDGLRLIAERSDKYEGQTKPEWCGADGVWKDIWLDKKPPAAARVGVYKKGFREALYASAIFDEYAQKNYDGSLGFMWSKMPSLMISKVAEALALRKAFPNDLSGIYSSEEMQQAEPLVQAEKDAKPINTKAAIEGQKAEAQNLTPDDAGEYIIKFGKKFAGKKVKDFLPHEHESMLRWLAGEAKKGQPLSEQAQEYIQNAEAFLSPDRNPNFNSQEKMP